MAGIRLALWTGLGHRRAIRRVGSRQMPAVPPNDPLAGLSGAAPQGDSERIEFLDQVVEREIFLLRLLGYPVNLLEGGDATDDLQHPVGVKR